MTKSTKLKKIIFTVISFILVILIAIVVLMFRIRHVYTDLDYCKEIGRKLGWLDLDQFHCSSIDNADHQHIQFYFRLNEYDDYSENECVKDIAKVKEIISGYLENNSRNELNNQLIICTFEIFPGVPIYFTIRNSSLNRRHSFNFQSVFFS